MPNQQTWSFLPTNWLMVSAKALRRQVKGQKHKADRVSECLPTDDRRQMISLS
jgi:hypothetical protein